MVVLGRWELLFCSFNCFRSTCPKLPVEARTCQTTASRMQQFSTSLRTLTSRAPGTDIVNSNCRKESLSMIYGLTSCFKRSSSAVVLVTCISIYARLKSMGRPNGCMEFRMIKGMDRLIFFCCCEKPRQRPFKSNFEN